MLAGQSPDGGPSAGRNTGRKGEPDFDIRVSGQGPVTASPAPEALDAGQRAAATRFALVFPDATLRWDALTGAPGWLALPSGAAIRSPAGSDPETAARAFVQSWSDLYGLEASEVDALALASRVAAPRGGWHVYLRQQVDGIDVLGGRLVITVDADGAVLTVGSRIWPGTGPVGRPALAASDAARVAARSVYPQRLFLGRVARVAEASPERRTTFDESEFGRPPEARLVWFPERGGGRLAWEVRLAEPSFGTDYRVVVDARDGTLLRRANMTRYAEGRVLLEDPDPESEEIRPTQHRVVVFPADDGSGSGWIRDDGTVLEGNNATTRLGGPDSSPLESPDGSYDFAFNTDEAALVNAWYWVNRAHDWFRAAGFDEAAGNYQVDNFGLGGLANDPVIVIRDPNATNASFTPAPDGAPGRLVFGWYYGTCRFCTHTNLFATGGDRHAGFRRDLLVHETAHGMTARRVGGPDEVDCLKAYSQPHAMAEGWSDLLAASFLDDPSLGDYATQGQSFLTDMRHDVGMGQPQSPNWPNYALAWSGTLWELREAMRVFEDDGIDRFHRLVIESLAIVPCEPTLLDGRDAMLAADTLLFDGEHHDLIWNVFAGRGMGMFAATTGPEDGQPTRDNTVPAEYACSVLAAPILEEVTAAGPNAIRLGYEAPGAQAVEVRRDDLDNVADREVVAGTTRDRSTFIDESVEGDKRYGYRIVALGRGGRSCRSAPSEPLSATATGPCRAEFPLFVPSLRSADGDPGCAITLTWDPASPACPGSPEPIVYNVYRDTTPGFLPSERLLIGRTTATTFVDVPPETGRVASHFELFYDAAPVYLVTAQHGTLDDRADHRDRGRAQVLEWRSAIPTLGRETTHFWDFESGGQGWWTRDDTGQAAERGSEWSRVQPNPTWFGDALAAPDEAAGGSGFAWVTGDPGAPPESLVSNTAMELVFLVSPLWDATDGSTLVSFDYWGYAPIPVGEFDTSMWICLGTSTHTVHRCIRDIGLQTTPRFDAPGRYGWQHYEIDVASATVPAPNQTLLFACNNCYMLSEYGIDNVRVERATACARSDLRLVDVTVDDTAPGAGNGNGYIEPGEVVRLVPSLANDGAAAAVAPHGSLRSRVPGAVVLDASATYAAIAADATALPEDDGFVVAMPPEAACDESYTFEFTFDDAGGDRTTTAWSQAWGRLPEEVLLEDDFESDLGWSPTGVSGPGQGAWERVVPSGIGQGPPTDSPNDANLICYVTGNQGQADDDDDVDPGASPMLSSPAFDVTGARYVDFSFDRWFSAGSSDGDLTWDTVTDSGERLTTKRAFRSGWTATDQRVYLDPTSPPQTPVRLRFTAHDLYADTTVEAAVDNVRVVLYRQVCDPPGVLPPLGIGDTLRLDRAPNGIALTWSAPPTDQDHDAAAYFEVRAAPAPDAAFATIATALAAPAEVPAGGATVFYLIRAVNAGGNDAP